MSVHLEILRRARMEGELYSTAVIAPSAEPERRAAARRPPVRDQWQQLVHELFLRRESETAAIGLASATAGEGTSFVARHLAAELARMSERPTLLLELNVYRPVQASAHGVEPDPGLRRLLASREFPVEECLRETGVQHLWVLPAGSGGPSGGTPDWMCLPRVLDALRRQFRALVVDLPPVNLSSDATIAARWLEGLVLVTEADACSREVIQSATARLRRANPNLLGAVLNKRRFVVPEAVYRRL